MAVRGPASKRGTTGSNDLGSQTATKTRKVSGSRAHARVRRKPWHGAMLPLACCCFAVVTTRVTNMRNKRNKERKKKKKLNGGGGSGFVVGTGVDFVRLHFSSMVEAKPVLLTAFLCGWNYLTAWKMAYANILWMVNSCHHFVKYAIVLRKDSTWVVQS